MAPAKKRRRGESSRDEAAAAAGELPEDLAAEVSRLAAKASKLAEAEEAATAQAVDAEEALARKTKKRRKAAVGAGEAAVTAVDAEAAAAVAERAARTAAAAEEALVVARRVAAALEDAEILDPSSDEESDNLDVEDSEEEEQNVELEELTKSAKARLAVERAAAKAAAKDAARKAKAARAQADALAAKLARREGREVGARTGDGAQGNPAAAKQKRQRGAPPDPDAACSSGDKPTDGKVWLGDLPWSTSEAVVRKDFGKFGEIEKLQFHLDKAGRPLGTAHLSYKDPAAAQKVLCLDGIDYKGRVIKVKRRSPRRRGGKRTRAGLVHQDSWRE